MASQLQGPRGQDSRSDAAAAQGAAAGDTGRSRAFAVLSGTALKLAAIGALTAVLQWPFVNPDLAPSALVLVYATAAASACSILVAARAVQHNARLRDGLETAVIAAVLAGVLAMAVTGDARALSITVAVFLLAAAFAALSSALQRVVAPSAAAVTTFILTGLAATSPLWGGPIVEMFSSQRWLAAAAVAASPLSFLATAADFDYLRTEWFYRFSVIGTLRYEYPTFLAFSAAYALPITGALLLAKYGSTKLHLTSTPPDSARSERSTTP